MQYARSQIGEIWWPTNHSSYQPTRLAALPLVAGLAKKPKVGEAATQKNGSG
jgi:hypothetical protein